MIYSSCSIEDDVKLCHWLLDTILSRLKVLDQMEIDKMAIRVRQREIWSVEMAWQSFGPHTIAYYTHQLLLLLLLSCHVLNIIILHYIQIIDCCDRVFCHTKMLMTLTLSAVIQCSFQPLKLLVLCPKHQSLVLN